MAGRDITQSTSPDSSWLVGVITLHAQQEALVSDAKFALLCCLGTEKELMKPEEIMKRIQATDGNVIHSRDQHGLEYLRFFA